MKTKKGLIKQLKAIKKEIARQRDKMRELLDEYESLIQCCEEADEDLRSVIEKLSEQV